MSLAPQGTPAPGKMSSRKNQGAPQKYVLFWIKRQAGYAGCVAQHQGAETTVLTFQRYSAALLGLEPQLQREFWESTTFKGDFFP